MDYWCILVAAAVLFLRVRHMAQKRLADTGFWGAPRLLWRELYDAVRGVWEDTTRLLKF